MTGSVSEPEWPSWFRWAVLPLAKNSMLWPVLAALLGHVILLVAVLLVDALRERRPLALLGLAAVALLSADAVVFELRRRRRLGALSVGIAVTWLAGAAVAFAAHRYGAY